MILLISGAAVALLLSFYLLNEVTDRFFIPSLDYISHKTKMSDDAAGATLMAAGSSAPELFISIIAILYGGDNFELGVGTIVGSALFNLLVIIGAVAFVKSSKVAWQPMFRDMLFYTLSIGMLYWAFQSGSINLYHVFAFVGLYILYVVAVLNWKKLFPYEKVEIDEDDDEDPEWKKYFRFLDYLLEKLFHSKKYIYNFFMSVVLIALLSWVLVESAVVISEAMGIPKYVIALTVLAFGTSIPDMISSIIVAKQGRGGMAISNALGSNIFDILIGLGLPWVVLISIKGISLDVVASNITTHILVLLASVVGMFVMFLITKWRVNRLLGTIFLGSYLVYLIYVIIQAS
jgi:K+-dependent Na+/Ca+ exchanger-like protein